MTSHLVLTVAAVGVALVGAGCGASSSGGGQASKPVDPNGAEVNPAGDIPDNQAYVAFSPPGAGYSVKVPEGWSRTASGKAVTFTDKLNAVRVQARPAGTPVTVRRAQRTVVPKLAQSVKGFHDPKVSKVTRQAGSAVRITYQASSNPDPVTGKVGTDAVERYAFFHTGTELVLTLSGPKGADNVDPWRIVTDSVRWTG